MAAPKSLSTSSPSPRPSSFTCSLCRESFRVDYHGRKPPFCPQIVFMEDVFCMRDPFSMGGGGSVAEGGGAGGVGEQRKCLPTVVGGTCGNCSRNVCAQCSFFYSIRLCGDDHMYRTSLLLRDRVRGEVYAHDHGSLNQGGQTSSEILAVPAKAAER